MQQASFQSFEFNPQHRAGRYKTVEEQVTTAEMVSGNVFFTEHAVPQREANQVWPTDCGRRKHLERLTKLLWFPVCIR